MTETENKPYSWIKSIPSALLQNDSIPLIGFPPSFPWEEFTEKLSKTFEVPELKISSEPFEWRSHEELLTGMGDRVLPMHFALSPLKETLSWLFAQEDIVQLMSFLLKTPSLPLGKVNPDFLEGFYRFLGMECVDVLMGLDFSKKLAPRILDKTDLPAHTSTQFLCMDVTIAFKEHTLLGRVVVSANLRKEFKERFAKLSLEETLNQPHVQNLEVPLHVEAGRTSIKLSEWKKVNVGDFIILDSCSLRPNEDGRILLTINHIPFFRGKLKDGTIKILEHPLYYQVGTPVDKNTKEHSFDDPSYEEEDEEFEEFEDDEEEYQYGEDNQDKDEEVESEIEEESSAVGNNTQESESFDEDQDLEHSDEDSQETSEEGVASQEGEKPEGIEDLMLSVIVEVGRLQMSVKQLMELQPGNLLNSNMRPENGVDLIVNGKCIAKGELLLVGETLGVRVLELG